jgi:aryl-alcohol dehydrogenase-like predicted oxidoreductase
MAYGPLAHGLLTGSFTAETVFGPQDWRSRGNIFGQRLFGPRNFRRNLHVVEQLKGVAGALGTTLPRLALAWVLHNPRVSVALCGTRRPAEIEENVTALDVHLSPEVLQQIDGIMAGAAGLRDKVPA